MLPDIKLQSPKNSQNITSLIDSSVAAALSQRKNIKTRNYSNKSIKGVRNSSQRFNTFKGNEPNMFKSSFDNVTSGAQNQKDDRTRSARRNLVMGVIESDGRDQKLNYDNLCIEPMTRADLRTNTNFTTLFSDNEPK